MTAFRVGEVVSVEFPFTDMQGRKRRPGVVLAIDSNDLLLARITTHEPRDPFDVSLEDWAAMIKPQAAARLGCKSSHARGALSSKRQVLHGFVEI